MPTKDRNNMPSLTQILHQEHQECDQRNAVAEEVSLAGDLDNARDPVLKAVQENLRHFRIEEEILFPAFEAATGMTGGPTQVMRIEHQQMKGLLEEMRQSLLLGNLSRIPKVSETLMLLMQQHNLKEENILYPMMDQHLGNQVESLIAKVKGFPHDSY